MTSDSLGLFLSVGTPGDVQWLHSRLAGSGESDALDLWTSLLYSRRGCESREGEPALHTDTMLCLKDGVYVSDGVGAWERKAGGCISGGGGEGSMLGWGVIDGALGGGRWREGPDEDVGRHSRHGDIARRPRAATVDMEKGEAFKALKRGVRAIVGVDSGVREGEEKVRASHTASVLEVAPWFIA